MKKNLEKMNTQGNFYFDYLIFCLSFWVFFLFILVTVRILLFFNLSAKIDLH